MEQLKQGFMDRPVSMRWVIRIIVGLIVLGLVLYLVMLWQSMALKNSAREAVREQVQREAIALAHTISVTSRDDILAKDYSKLQSYFADLVKEDRVDYLIVMASDGRAVVHTNARDRGKIMIDNVSRKARKADDTLVQTLVDDKVYDVAVPVMGLTRKEATVRVGISYESTEKLFRK